MDFTPLSRQYGEAGTGLMLVPAWDFDLDRWLHGHMAVMRGVESGFSIARAAKQGYLTVSDDRGRILAETRSDAAPFATLIADVPAVHNTTLYRPAGRLVRLGRTGDIRFHAPAALPITQESAHLRRCGSSQLRYAA